MEYNGGQWHTVLVSQSVFSLYTCYVNIRVSQTIPKSLEAGTIQNHFIYRDVWNLKGCSIGICGFFWKKLLLLWGLLNKDLIAMNACVQGKWKHAKLCNSSALDIWQRTIVGYNSWLVPIWGLNQKTEFGSQIYRMYGFFMLCNQDGKGSVFILQKEDYLYIFQILQIRQHWLHWQHNYLCFSYILHFVCLSVIVGIGRLTERWMNLDLGSVYYQV